MAQQQSLPPPPPSLYGINFYDSTLGITCGHMGRMMTRRVWRNRSHGKEQRTDTIVCINGDSLLRRCLKHQRRRGGRRQLIAFHHTKSVDLCRPESGRMAWHHNMSSSGHERHGRQCGGNGISQSKYIFIIDFVPRFVTVQGRVEKPPRCPTTLYSFRIPSSSTAKGSYRDKKRFGDNSKDRQNSDYS